MGRNRGESTNEYDAKQLIVYLVLPYEWKYHVYTLFVVGTWLRAVDGRIIILV